MRKQERGMDKHARIGLGVSSVERKSEDNDSIDCEDKQGEEIANKVGDRSANKTFHTVVPHFLI